MHTNLQKNALEELVAAGRTKKRIIKSQVLIKAGYSRVTAKIPDKVFKSDGFLELANELGLTDDFLTKALVADIKAKPGRRKAELELGFKVKQLLKEDERKTTNIQINVFDSEQSKRVAKRILNENPTE